MPALTIGGATLRVAGDDAPASVAPPLYRPFLHDGGSPSLTLTLRPLEASPVPPGTPFYDSGRNWHVVATPAGSFFRFLGDRPPGAPPVQTLAVDAGWRSAVLHGEPRAQPAAVFPLAYPTEQILLVSLLARATGLVVHATAVIAEGRGWIFAGTHGAGKSTLARHFGRDRAFTVLNDDRVVLRRDAGGGWRVFGTPWAGTVRRASSASAPVAGLFLIRHGARTRATRLAPDRASAPLLARCFHSYWDREGLDGVVATAVRASREVPCYELAFTMDLAGVRETLVKTRKNNG